MQQPQHTNAVGMHGLNGGIQNGIGTDTRSTTCIPSPSDLSRVLQSLFHQVNTLNAEKQRLQSVYLDAHATRMTVQSQLFVSQQKPLPAQLARVAGASATVDASVLIIDTPSLNYSCTTTHS